MSLSPGSRLGPYEIVSPLGAGGMGEVWKARDTRLERTVAIKILSPRLSASPESRQRFEREAKTISQLSHPHICALYDVGREEGTEYLVMEYLEGETLLDRLAKGALPLDQTLRYGGQIADALDKAHRQGIVHRDLKPGNVMLTKSGVKLLDFGLAKAFEGPVAKGTLTSLPTKEALTQEGAILGTFQYMAPEQLQGQEADARTDIFALGTVLYEMAAGKKAFSASNQASLITAIMSADPAPISTAQPMSPPALDRVVRTCLAKDPEDRWQSAGDVAKQLMGIAESSAAGLAAPAATPARHRLRERLAWIVAAGLAVALAASLWRPGSRPTAVSRSEKRLTILPPPGLRFGSSFAVSPDGNAIAFVAGGGDVQTLWIRRLDTLDARRVPGTEGADFPFWSPDGRRLGFFASGKLKIVDVGGGAPPRALCDAEYGRGGTWSPLGTIVFSPGWVRALLRIPDRGGQPVPATKLSAPVTSSSHRWPWFLSDGRRYIFLALSASEEGRPIEARNDRFCVGSIENEKVDCFASGNTNLASTAAGFLLSTRARALIAMPFDEKAVRLTGEPRTLAEEVGRYGAASGPTGYSPFSVSTGGTLVYGRVESSTCRVVWVDRTGAEEGKPLAEGDFAEPDLSTDGSRAILIRDDPQTGNDLWSLDVSRGALSRLTFYGGDIWSPLLSPDSSRVVYSLTRSGGGHGDLFTAPATGTGTASLLWESPETKLPIDWSSDGRTLLVDVQTAKNRSDIWTVSMEGEPRPRPLLVTPFEEGEARFSPDGRIFAYKSDETGRSEIYVQTFPPSGAKWQVSPAGGRQPQWRSDGKELYYIDPDDNVTAVDVRTSPVFSTGLPRALFKTRAYVMGEGRNSFVPAPDGRRFLVLTNVTNPTPPTLTVLLDWTAAPRK